MIVDPNKPAYKFLQASEILPREILTTLTPEAQKLYQTVWNRFRDDRKTTLMMFDVDVSNRSRLRPERLVAAQSELVRANLLAMTPGPPQQTQYTFIE
jgi:DNA replication initiation complex subunit (GINS family)